MNVLARIRSALRHPVSQNVLSLYGVQFATFLLPLLTLPYLSRVLEPSGFGLVVFAQGLSFLLSALIDWGYPTYASREAATSRDDHDALSRLVSRVLAAKLVLAAVALAVALVVGLSVGTLRDHPEYAALAWVAAVGNAMTPVWFFIGLERARTTALVSLIARLVSTALTFVLVRDTADGWIVMALYACGAVAGAVLVTRLAYRAVPALAPDFGRVRRTIAEAWPLFLTIIATTLYTAFNVVLLGFFAPTDDVAHFGAAERVIRSGLLALGPIGIAAYPRLAWLQARGEHRRALKLLLILLAGVGGLAAGGCLVVGLVAPDLIRVIFGPDFGESVDVLRVMLILVPANVVASICAGWLLSLHMDHFVSRAALAIGIFNVALGCVLAPLYGPVGMAVSVVCAEGLAAVVAGGATWRSWRRLRDEPPAAAEPA